MNTFRQICAAMILSLTLAVTVWAGHIDTPGAPAPAPRPTPATGSATHTTSTTTSIVQTILSLIFR